MANERRTPAPLSERDRKRLLRQIEEHGSLHGASRALGVSRESIARGSLGLLLRKGTVLLLERALDAAGAE